MKLFIIALLSISTVASTITPASAYTWECKTNCGPTRTQGSGGR